MITNTVPKDKNRTVNQKVMSNWTFLTNHLHVIACIHNNSEITVRNLSQLVGITERSTQRIIADLESEGALRSEKQGRNKVYSIDHTFRLRHPLENNHTIGELLNILSVETEQGNITS